MTDLEARVSSLECNVLALAKAVSEIATTHALFASAAIAHLNGLSAAIKEMRDDEDSWDDFR